MLAEELLQYFNARPARLFTMKHLTRVTKDDWNDNTYIGPADPAWLEATKNVRLLMESGDVIKVMVDDFAAYGLKLPLQPALERSEGEDER